MQRNYLFQFFMNYRIELKFTFLTISGCGFKKPWCSTFRKYTISIPRFLARRTVGDLTSLVAINFRRHLGARSISWLHLESLSTMMTEISAENIKKFIHYEHIS